MRVKSKKKKKTERQRDERVTDDQLVHSGLIN